MALGGSGNNMPMDVMLLPVIPALNIGFCDQKGIEIIN